MAELLLEKGYTVNIYKRNVYHMNLIMPYQVHGIIRRSSTFNTGRILHLYADRASHTAGSENIDTITLRTHTCSYIY